MSKDYAVCIGINDYNNLQSLKYAERDAKAVRNFFVSKAGFDKVYYFADDAPPIGQDYGPNLSPKPTFTSLKRFLRVRFDNPFLSSEDNFWFFFAGHGLRHQGRDYLMLLDSDPGDIRSTSISINEITESLQNCGADNIMLLIDACRDQGRRSGEGIGEDSPPGVIKFYSCMPHQSSYEIDELQSGTFTYVLLKALRGEEKCATVQELADYLQEKVPALNKEYNKPVQNPIVGAEPIEKANLIIFPERATSFNIILLTKSAQEAELKGDFTLAESLWKRVLNISQDKQAAFDGLKRVWLKATTETTKKVTESREDDVSSSEGNLLTDEKISSPYVPRIVTHDFAKSNFEFEVIRIDDQGIELGRRLEQKTCYLEELGNGITLELINIQGGSYTMGSSKEEYGRTKREGPQHEVVIKPFLMGRYPITQAQWNVVSLLPKVNIVLESHPSNFRGATNPVECVNWYEAIEFCHRLSCLTGHSYRLPSEAEWEYACRATTTTPFHFGETIRTEEANYHGEYRYEKGPKGIYRQATTPVDKFLCANEFGLSDMHGNVSEWCQDIWHYNYVGAPQDGNSWTEDGNQDSRVVRGGSWSHDPSVCRSASRYSEKADLRDESLGFRIVIST